LLDDFKPYITRRYPFLTQKERDIETGLDYFGARYYASTQGRFTSVDDFWKDSQVGDPQSGACQRMNWLYVTMLLSVLTLLIGWRVDLSNQQRKRD
jgi:RHS repeat-associated protein